MIKKIMLLILFGFSALPQPAFAEDNDPEVVVDVVVDTSNNGTYIYEAPDHTRGHPFLIQPPQSVAAKGEHYDQAEKDSPYFSEGEKLKNNMPVLVRYQIDNYLNTFRKKKFGAEAFSLYGVNVPTELENPGDMIQIITGESIPKDKIFIGSAFSDALALKKFVSSKHLLFWSANQILKSGGGCLLISDEGTDKFFASTGFQVGLGSGGGKMSDSENSYVQGVVGMSYSSAKTGYTKPPYIQIFGGWLVSKAELALWWELYEDISPCDPGQTHSAEYVFSPSYAIDNLGFWDMLKLMAIEHWIWGKRFTDGCEMPAELHAKIESAAAVPQTAVIPQTKEMTIMGKKYTPDVLFKFGKSEFLNQEQLDNAQKLVELTVRLAVAAKANGETVYLHGTCSGEGGKDLNLRLGYDRAEAIAAPARKVALANGIVSNKKEAEKLIQSVSSGKEWLEFPEPADAPRNRRTRLIVGKVKSGVVEKVSASQKPAPQLLIKQETAAADAP